MRFDSPSSCVPTIAMGRRLTKLFCAWIFKDVAVVKKLVKCGSYGRLGACKSIYLTGLGVLF
jgi:hypothetical protein